MRYNSFVSVFLSHSSKDKGIVKNVYDILKSKPTNVWIDEVELVTGDMLLKKIDTAIEYTQILVLFLSKNSIKSSWVEYEWRTFVDMKIRENKTISIIPILLAVSRIG